MKIEVISLGLITCISYEYPIADPDHIITYALMEMKLQLLTDCWSLEYNHWYFIYGLKSNLECTFGRTIFLHICKRFNGSVWNDSLKQQCPIMLDCERCYCSTVHTHVHLTDHLINHSHLQIYVWSTTGRLVSFSPYTVYWPQHDSRLAPGSLYPQCTWQLSVHSLGHSRVHRYTGADNPSTLADSVCNENLWLVRNTYQISVKITHFLSIMFYQGPYMQVFFDPRIVHLDPQFFLSDLKSSLITIRKGSNDPFLRKF